MEEYRRIITRKAPHNWFTVNKLILYRVACAEAGPDDPDPSWIWSSEELADFLKVCASLTSDANVNITYLLDSPGFMPHEMNTRTSKRDGLFSGPTS